MIRSTLDDDPFSGLSRPRPQLPARATGRHRSSTLALESLKTGP